MLIVIFKRYSNCYIVSKNYLVGKIKKMKKNIYFLAILKELFMVCVKHMMEEVAPENILKFVVDIEILLVD